jgi:hypothetical protein
MGIGQWTRQSIAPGSFFCNQYNVKAGEYLIMYDTSTSELLIKEPNQGRIVFRKYASSLRDLVSILASSAPNQTDSEILQRLKRGGKSRGGGQIRDHHIIPVHLWKDCQLVVMAVKYGINMNGSDNMMLLPDEFHRANHSKDSPYSQIVRSYLRDRWNALVEAGLDDDPDEIKDQLLSLIDALRANLKDLVAEGGCMNGI